MVGDKKRSGLGPDEELRDGGEDGDDDEGEQEVLALVKAGQHRGCPLHLGEGEKFFSKVPKVL